MTTTSRSRGVRTFGSAARAVLALSFLLCVLFFRHTIEDLLWRVAAPIAALRDRFDASENARLTAALASTTAALADRDQLYQENLQLKTRLRRGAEHSSILAGVLMRPPATPYDTLIIDAGSAEGVAPGQLVSAGGTTLIGSVREVYAHTARVVLLSSAGEKYDAILGNTTALGIVGQGAGSMVGQVPAGTPVVVGELVVFPGVRGGFVGTVSRVDSAESDSFETIYLHLPVDPFALSFVEVWQQ